MGNDPLGSHELLTLRVSDLVDLLTVMRQSPLGVACCLLGASVVLFQATAAAVSGQVIRSTCRVHDDRSVLGSGNHAIGGWSCQRLHVDLSPLSVLRSANRRCVRE